MYYYHGSLGTNPTSKCVCHNNTLTNVKKKILAHQIDLLYWIKSCSFERNLAFTQHIFQKLTVAAISSRFVSIGRLHVREFQGDIYISTTRATRGQDCIKDELHLHLVV